MSRDTRIELKVLEELFKDQLDFKVRSVLELLAVRGIDHVKIGKHLDEIVRLTDENLMFIEKEE